MRLALELQAAETAVGRVGRDDLRRFRELHEDAAAAVSQTGWDSANAAFHEHQVDLAANGLLSRFYRELSVNLMMQVIRGGRLEGGSYLPTEHGAIVDAYEAGDPEAACAAIRDHIATGRRIALEAIEQRRRSPLAVPSVAWPARRSRARPTRASRSSRSTRPRT